MSYAASPQPALGGATATNTQAAQLATNTLPNYSGAGYGTSSGYNINNTANTFSATPASQPPKVNTTQDANALGNSTGQYNLPAYTPPGSSNSFVSSLPGYQAPQDQGGTGAGDSTQPAANPKDAARSQFLDAYGGLVNKLGLEGDEFNNLQGQYQIPQMTQQLASLRGTIAQRTAGYTAQWQLANTEHAALPYITGEQTQIQRTQAVELGVLGAQEQALSGNLQAASDLVDRTIQHEFEPIKNQLQYMGQAYNMMKDDLTASEQLQTQQNFSIATLNYQNLLNTKKDAYNTAIQYGAPSSTLTALANAKTTQDVYAALSGVVTGTDSSNSSVVNGYDLSTYATDPQYASKILATSTAIGPIASVPQVDQLIKGSAPNSPITGSMIATAANQYGVDPNMLTSVLKLESNFGTMGAGAKTNNPGNVGNTDSGATKQFPDWQSGVNATAQQLANRKTTPNQVVQDSTQQNTQQQLIQTAPLMVRPAIRFTSTGTPYIDKTRLGSDATTQSMAQSFSARSKGAVPILDDADVKTVNSLNDAMMNLSNVESSFNNLAPGSLKGGVGGGITNALGPWYFKISAPINKMFDSDYGANLKAYQTNRDFLFQQINALAGSNPRINTNELTAAANALPKLDEFNTDSMKDGAAKLSLTKGYLNNALGNILPNYKPADGVAPGSTVTGANNTEWKVNPDGSYTRTK